jgi:limonene-1,2-epoxide hydrolase
MGGRDELTVSCEADSAVVEALRAILAAYNAHDVDGLVDRLCTPDIVMDDHRRMSLQTFVGPEQAKAALAATHEMWPDFNIRVEMLAQEGEAYLARDTYRGRDSITGGESELEWFVVDQLRDRKLAREDIFDTEEEARARFERLTA